MSAHNLLIAAIFIPYLALMIGLGAYIYRTGHPRSDDPPDTEEDPGPAAVPAAA